MSRLVPALANRINASILHPVIIEAYPNRLLEVFEQARPYFQVWKEMENRTGISRPRLLGGFMQQALGAMSDMIPNLFTPRIIKRFSMLNAILPRDIVEDFAQDSNVIRIYPDTLKYAFAYPTVPQNGRFYYAKRNLHFTSTEWTKRLMGCDKANAQGYTGKGILVAVVDTGSSRVHEQMRGKVEFKTEIKVQHRDDNGHGTWCASCIAGHRTRDDGLSRVVGRNIYCEGMAPDAFIYAIKSLGYGIGCGSDSSIIKGIEDAVEAHAHVISMSLGGDVKAKRPEDDPFYKVIKKVSDSGIIPVIAAGNSGPKAGTVGTPGAMPDALTVAAYDPIKGVIADFSSRGPTPWGDIKPDVAAPGVNIDSATVGILDYAEDKMPNRYTPLSGTSMATPHVAGLVACMKQQMPELTTNEIKKMMAALGHEKTNIDGWGPITWQMWEEWLSTQYGIESKRW